MAEIQPLPNAPIKEALIDIRVVANGSVEIFEKNYAQFSEEYPEKHQIQRNTIGWEIGKGDPVSSTVNQQYVGYKYLSADKKNIVQFRTDGFTFSRLEPYQDWKSIRDEAKRLWDIYSPIAGIEAISRIAVRYINALKIPLPISDFREYLTASPEVPEGLPQAVSDHLTRLVIHDPTLNVNCNLTQALQPMEPDSSDFITIILDIDAYIISNYDINSLKYWQDLEILHDFKNRVFFKSVTDKAIELFK